MAAVKRRGPQEDELPPEPKPQEAPKSLESQVMEKLGNVENFYKCQIVNVGDQRWRVNVRVFVPSNNTVSVTKIAHSFYLKTNEKGKIVGGDEIPSAKV